MFLLFFFLFQKAPLGGFFLSGTQLAPGHAIVFCRFALFLGGTRAVPAHSVDEEFQFRIDAAECAVDGVFSLFLLRKSSFAFCAPNGSWTEIFAGFYRVDLGFFIVKKGRSERRRFLDKESVSCSVFFANFTEQLTFGWAVGSTLDRTILGLFDLEDLLRCCRSFLSRFLLFSVATWFLFLPTPSKSYLMTIRFFLDSFVLFLLLSLSLSLSHSLSLFSKGLTDKCLLQVPGSRCHWVLLCCYYFFFGGLAAGHECIARPFFTLEEAARARSILIGG